jgi:hypothetical protein
VLYQRSILKEEQMENLKPLGESTKPSFSMISIILPIVINMVTVGFYIYMNLSGKMGNSNFIMFQIITTVMMLMSYIFPFFIYIGNKKKYVEKVSERNRMYLVELVKHREQLRAGTMNQVNILYNKDDPEICFQTIKNRSGPLWERSPEDDATSGYGCSVISGRGRSDQTIIPLFMEMITQCKKLFVEAGVKTIAAYRRSQVVQLTQVIVVIDGYVYNVHIGLLADDPLSLMM